MLITIVVSILSNLLSILIPVSIGKYYDLVFEFNSHRSQIFNYLPFDVGASIETFLILFFGMVVLKSIALFLEKYCFGLLSERLAFQLRNQLFDSQIYLPIPVYEEKGMGKYLLRFSGDLKSIQTYMRNGIIRFASDLCLFVVTIGVLISFHTQLGVLVGAILLITTVVVGFLNQKLSSITRDRRNSKSALLTFVNIRLRAIQSIRQFNKEKPEKQKFLKKSQKVYDRGIAYQKITALIRTLVPSAMYWMLGLVLAFSFYLKQNATAINGSVLLVFIMLLITLLPIFRRLLNVNIVWELGNISFEKLLKVINQAETNKQALPDFKFKEGIIEFKNAAFAYPEESNLFQNLNWVFYPEQIHLITGSSGSGKGTIIKLITAVYEANEGSVWIDGQNVQLVNPKSLRKHIAIVSSSLPLLGKTVFEAISYSRKNEKRAKAQEILDDIQTFLPPKQRLTLDDLIGELGSNLSKGQQKILAYARALLTNKSILLIDEPSADLDEATAVKVFEMLHDLKEKKRAIVLFSRQEQFLFLSIDEHYNINDNMFQYYSL